MAKKNSKAKRKAMMEAVRAHKAQNIESPVDSNSKNALRFASPQGSLLVQRNSPPRAVLPPCISTSPSVPSPPCVAEEAQLAVLPPCSSEAPTSPPPPWGAARINKPEAKDVYKLGYKLANKLGYEMTNKQSNNITYGEIYQKFDYCNNLTHMHCKYKRSVKGNFNQGNIEIFGTNAGNQCTAMSFIAITYNQVKSFTHWSSRDLDKILFEGDKLYSSLKNSNSISHNYIDVHELPHKLQAFEIDFSYHFHDRIPVLLNATNDDIVTFDSYSLLEALTIAFDSAKACFITFADYTFVISKNQGIYFAFDSHARNANGCLDSSNGTSVMVEIESLEEVHTYCLDLLKSIRGENKTSCEVTGVNITLDTTIQQKSDHTLTDTSDVLFVNESPPKHIMFQPLNNDMQTKLCDKVGIPVSKYLKLKCSKELQYNVYTEKIRGDGNCFFRAISFALSGTEQFYNVVRNKVVNYMASRPHHFKSLLRLGYENIPQYLKKSLMAKSDTWATEMEIVATADFLNTDIYTLRDCLWIKYSGQQLDKTKEPFDCSIYLKHCNNNHYDYVKGIPPATPSVDEEASQNCNVIGDESFKCSTDIKSEVTIGGLSERKEYSHVELDSSKDFKKNNGKTPTKRKRLAYSTRLKNDKINKRMKRMCSQILDHFPISESEKQFLAPNVNEASIPMEKSFYKKNEKYQMRVKALQRQRYKNDPKLRHKKIISGIEKYNTKTAYREQLMDSSKNKYKFNNIFRAKIIESGKLKYKTDDNYRSQLIESGKLKYKTDDNYRSQLIESGKVKYKTDDNYRSQLIESGKVKYKTDDNYRSQLIESGKVKYKTDDNYRSQLIESGKVKYKTDDNYRSQLIESGKVKYKTDDNYRSQLIESGKVKYKTDDNHRSQLIESGKVKYKTDDNYRSQLIKSGKVKYKTDDNYRSQLIKSGKAKYRADNNYRSQVIESGKAKYRADDSYRTQLIETGKTKYRTDDNYRSQLRKSSKIKYKTDDCFRSQLIESGKTKYRTDDRYRNHLKKLSKMQYETNDVFKFQKLKSIKKKYRTNEQYRNKLIMTIKRKYSTDVNYRKRLISTIKTKYNTNMDYRENQINYIKSKYKTNQSYRNELIKKAKVRSKERYIHDGEFKACKIEAGKQRYKENKQLQKELIDGNNEFRGNQIIRKIISAFKKECMKGPEYVCCSCNRLLFQKQVLACNRENYEKKGTAVSQVAHKCISERYVHVCSNECDDDCSYGQSARAKLWICHTCHRKIMNGCTPAESTVNNLQLENLPECLQSLNNLEQHLVALHIPFMKILALPKGGQKGVNGPVVCVPADIEQTTNKLPRSDGNDMLLRVKLKRKLSYKGHYKYETINQRKLENALAYLIEKNKWYSEVTINRSWLNPLPEENINLIDSEESIVLSNSALNSENDISTSNNTGETDAELEETSNGLQFDSCLQPLDIGQHVLDQHFDDIMNLAPSERHNPVNILQEHGNEAKIFPVHFPSGSKTFNDDRDVRITLSRYFNARLMNVDNRFAKDTNYIFYSQYLSEVQQVMSSVSIACRKSTGKTTSGSDITAEMIKDGKTFQDLLNSDQIYKFLTPVRGTPPYWQTAQKDLFAMIRQLGIPTWFCSFSSADLRWKEIINTILTQQTDDRKFDDLDWNEKCDILRSNPVTTARMFDHRFHTFLKDVILSDAAPIGKVKDYFYRVEFQKRGSPHVHCLFWVDRAPKFDIDGDAKVIDFVNKYVTCNVPDDAEDPDLYEIVTSVQQHSKNHSPTCKKRGTRCRFNFPRAPSDRSFIIRPLTDDENDENLVKEAKDNIQKVWNILTEEKLETITCPQLFQKAGISQSSFEEALNIVSKRNDIVLKRKFNEIWTNQYNETLLRCWDANMDIQFVLDAYACIVYVISYISKAEREMGLLLRQTRQEAEESNLDAQKTMRKLGSTYLNSREISAQEAVYRVCNLRLKECSRKVQFVPVGENPVRMRLPLKSLSLENENIWMSSINEKYHARPVQEHFELMCLVEFCSEYRILAKSQVPKSMRNNEKQDESKSVYRLQKSMGFIQKRTRTDPAVVRYARFSESKAPEQYFQSILELFLPHRHKSQLKPPEFERYENFYLTGSVKLISAGPVESVKSIVEYNKQKFDINSEIIDEAHERMQTINPEDAWANLCPETELERDECRNGAVTTVEDDETPEDINLEFQNNFSVSLMEPNRNLFTREEVYPLLCSMNEKQTLAFYKVRQWCLDIIHGKNPKPFHLFVTGGAGTGKSHLIKCIYYEATRILAQIATNPDDTTVLLTAPTGTAAFNIRGRTYHSALSIPIIMGDDYDGLGEEKLNTLRSKLGNLQIFVIDEVSLVNKKQFYWISERLKQIKKSKGRSPFGNVSVIAVGDFYQLPPVGIDVKFSLYQNNFSFPVNLWHDYFSVLELDQIMRQQDDLAFANMLNRCRVKNKNEKLDVQDLNMLKECCGRNTDDTLHICPRNKQVNDYNDEMLLKTCVNITSFPAEDFRKDKRNGRLIRRAQPYDEKTLKTNLPSILKVAETARVMLVRNMDVEDGLVNGVIGTVVRIIANQIFVLFDNERVGRKAACKKRLESVPENAVGISPVEEHFNYRDGAVRKQFPLRLAWACTVHKVQGLTMDKIVVSLKTIFASGQAYVAFSRVKTQSGLYITDDYNEKLLQKKIYCEEGIHDAIESMPKFITISEDFLPEHTTLVLHNIEGLVSNLPSLRRDSRFYNVDYLCLTETWLSGVSLEAALGKLDNFSFHNRPRHLSYSSAIFESLRVQHKGGVGVFVKDSLQFQPEDLSLPDLEYYSFAIWDREILVTVLYRPNSYPLELFLNTLKELQEISSGYPISIIMGDFNENILVSCTIKNLMETGGYHQLVEELTTHHGTLIDHVYVKGATNVRVEVIPTFYSYHEAIRVKIFRKM